jgi:lipid-A-disaccharide synthase
VGHPYFDELRNQKLDADFVRRLRSGAGPLVTILPGSRTQEVESNTLTFLRAAKQIAAHVPDARFAIAAFKDSQAEMVRVLALAAGVSVEVHVGRTPELIHAADCCLACSGSVSLELLYHAKPSVILYQVGRVGYFIQSMFRRVRYITLVNLLTAKDIAGGFPAGIYDPKDPRDAHVLMPEYLSYEDRSQQLAGHVIEWLTVPGVRTERASALTELRDQFAQGGASIRGASYISEALTDAQPASAAA